MTIFKPGDLVVPVDEEQEKEIFRQLDFLISRGETFSFPFVVSRHLGNLVYFGNGYSCYPKRVKLFCPKEVNLDDYL